MKAIVAEALRHRGISASLFGHHDVEPDTYGANYKRFLIDFTRDEKKNIDRAKVKAALEDVALVNEQAYEDAVNYGADALPSVAEIDRAAIQQNLQAKIYSLADKARLRVGNDFADHVDTLMQHPDLSNEMEQFWKSVQDKLDAYNSQMTTYGEPPWTGGYVAYGESLAHFDVLMDWVLDTSVSDHCADCEENEGGGPYAAGDIPGWPKDGSTQCMANCYCTIQAESDSWAAAFGEE